MSNFCETSTEPVIGVVEEPLYSYLGDYPSIAEFRINLRETVFAFNSRSRYILRRGCSVERSSYTLFNTEVFATFGYKKLSRGISLFTYSDLKPPNPDRFIAVSSLGLQDSLEHHISIDVLAFASYNSSVFGTEYIIDKTLCEYLSYQACRYTRSLLCIPAEYQRNNVV